MLDLKVWRDFRQMKLRGLAITVGIGLLVAYQGGYYMAIESGKYSYSRMCQDLNLADLQVFLEPSREDELPRFDDISGIKVIKKRLFVPGTVMLKSGRNLPVYVVYDTFADPNPINTLKVLQGGGLTKEDAVAPRQRVLIERTMNSAHGFGVGDQLSLNVYGHDIEVDVRGIVLSPEFLFPSANPNLLLTAKGSLGIIFCDMAAIERLFGYALYNNLSFIFDKGYTASVIEGLIRERLGGLTLEAFLPQRESLDQKIINGGYLFAKKFGPIASTVMGIVVLIILYINMYRMIEEKRTENAILLALGFERKDIAIYFLKIVACYVVIGSIVGFCGSFFLNPLFALHFAKHLEFPELRFVHVPEYPLQGIGYGILVTAVAFTCASVNLWRLGTPRSVIRARRGETIFSTSRTLSRSLQLLPIVGRSLFAKYAFRGMVRHRTLTLVTILSVAFALALAVSFNILLTSTNSTLLHFYDHDPWNLVVDLKSPMNQQEISEILSDSGIKEYEGYLKGMARLMVHGSWSFAQIIGLDASSRMRRLEVVEGTTFSSNDAWEVILNRNLWRDRPLELGDMVTIETPNGRHEMKLVGTVDEVCIAVEYAYLPLATAQRIMAHPHRYTGLWARVDLPVQLMEKHLYGHEMISRITWKNDIAKIIEAFMSSYRAGITGVLAMVMLLAPIFMFTTMGLGILERERDFIILRSMGFQTEHIGKILFIEALFIGSIAALLSLGLAIGLGVLQNKLASATYFTLNTYVVIGDYNYVACCYPLFPLVALVFTRRIMKLNVVHRLARRIS